ncbi:MAG: lysophospholipid acyltransferase family protein [Candidatus Sericytochromatia bacterium]
MLEVFFRVVAALVSGLPRRPVQSIASGLAGLLYACYRLSPQREFMAGNIREALPGLPPEPLARDHVRLLLWAIVDLLRFRRLRSPRPCLPEVLALGWTHFEAAHAQGRGVLLVSGHLGCWELFPAWVSLQGYPVTVLVQKPSQDGFDRLFRRFRAYAGVTTCNNDSVAGLRPLLKALQRGEVVGMLVDQHGESERLTGDFFGHRVSFPEGPAQLARRYGTPIVPVMMRWRGSKHVLEFFPALNPPPQAAPQEVMQQIYAWLEAQIRRYPENWLWSYNRWDKYRCDAS